MYTHKKIFLFQLKHKQKRAGRLPKSPAGSASSTSNTSSQVSSIKMYVNPPTQISIIIIIIGRTTSGGFFSRGKRRWSRRAPLAAFNCDPDGLFGAKCGCEPTVFHVSRKKTGKTLFGVKKSESSLSRASPL